jgi:hypothetical protein
MASGRSSTGTPTRSPPPTNLGRCEPCKPVSAAPRSRPRGQQRGNVGLGSRSVALIDTQQRRHALNLMNLPLPSRRPRLPHPRRQGSVADSLPQPLTVLLPAESSRTGRSLSSLVSDLTRRVLCDETRYWRISGATAAGDQRPALLSTAYFCNRRLGQRPTVRCLLMLIVLNALISGQPKPASPGRVYR